MARHLPFSAASIAREIAVRRLFEDRPPSTPAFRNPESDAVNEPRQVPDLSALLAIFYAQPGDLASFEMVAADDVPPPYHELLVHEHHMTVTMEAHHGCAVDVRVLRKVIAGRHYARMILLERSSDRRVVQFGIMRVSFAHLSEAVRRDVESEAIPLGRVLIQHDVLRRIRLSTLWRVTPGADLCRYFGLAGTRPTFGRTALIDCNDEPAVELLEVVAPE